jgi:hypothetical protein
MYKIEDIKDEISSISKTNCDVEKLPLLREKLSNLQEDLKIVENICKNYGMDIVEMKKMLMLIKVEGSVLVNV